MIAPDRSLRCRLGGVCWEDLPPFPEAVSNYALIVKEEARRLYVLKYLCEELLIQEFSVDSLSWRVIRPVFPLDLKRTVYCWVDHPTSPVILITTKERDIFSFNSLTADEEVKKVGELCNETVQLNFVSTEDTLISISGGLELRQDKIYLL